MATDSPTPVPPTLKVESSKEISLPTAVLALDADTAGSKLYAGCLDGTVLEVEAATGQHTTLTRHESYVSGVQFLRQARQVVSAGYDGALTWWDVEQRKVIRTVAAHKFWSWQLHASKNEKWVASVTGQYLAGGYKYEPSPEIEPSVKVFSAESGELRWSFPHVPPVLSVAFSPDNRFLAAGNMMGEVRVWDLESGQQVSTWTTPSFTSWGIIKSHHYIGGIFDLTFTPDSREVVVCGMGPMGDPMAGNGKQTWQRFTWADGKKVDQIREGDAGNGLMETIQYHPNRPLFLMAGRLAQGKWNVAFFEAGSQKLLHSIDNKIRVTDSVFLGEGNQLALSGAVGQEKKKNGKCPDFGRIKLYRV